MGVLFGIEITKSQTTPEASAVHRERDYSLNEPDRKAQWLLEWDDQTFNIRSKSVKENLTQVKFARST